MPQLFNPKFLQDMESQSVIIVITVNARPEKRKEVSQTLHSIVAQLRMERGCRRANSFQSIENENVFLVLEEWETELDAESHLKSDIFTIIIGARSLMSQPPDICMHTVSRSKTLKV